MANKQSWEEIKRTYPDEWVVLVNFQEQDEDITEGVVLDSQYANLHETIRRLFENDESTDAELDADGKALPSLRTLCGGTLGMYRGLRETHPAGGPQPGRCHVARLAMFALGFDVSG